MKPTPPQAPAVLCGLFPGARADLAGNRYQATEEFEAGVWQFKYRTNHGVQHITMSCHDMALLLDSPLALCHAARWLATRLGMDPGVTAPSWERLQCRQHCCDGATGEIVDCTRPVWSIMGADDVYVIFADCPDPEEWDGDDVRHVPGISDLTDPAEALAAACVAVGGAS